MRVNTDKICLQLSSGSIFVHRQIENGNLGMELRRLRDRYGSDQGHQ